MSLTTATRTSSVSPVLDLYRFEPVGRANEGAAEQAAIGSWESEGGHGAPAGTAVNPVSPATFVQAAHTTVSILTLPRPRLAVVLGHLAVSLLIASVIPGALFYVCLVTIGLWAALVAALGWCYGVLTWRMATRRRVSGLLVLTGAVLTVRTAFALASGDAFWYFLQPVVSDAGVAAVFLVSLASARPVVARLAADFYPMSDDVAARPRVQRLFWHLTLLWAVVCIGKAAVTLWLLQSQSVATFVLAKNVVLLGLTALAVAATVLAAAAVARKEGLLRQP